MENHLVKDSVHFVIIINQVGDGFQYILLNKKLKKRFLCIKNIAKDQMLLRYPTHIAPCFCYCKQNKIKLTLIKRHFNA